MTLTPATVRLDLKCGKGSISPGEKCTKGPATKVESARPQLSKKRIVAAATAGAVLAASLYQIRNMRQAYAQKFDPAQLYTPYRDSIGDVSSVIKNMQRSSKQAAPSLFGDVTFGEHKGQNIVVKQMGKKGASGAL